MARDLYLHALVGRLRVKVPAVKRSRTVAGEVEALLHSVGVSHVSANPWTGNVLVLYDADRATQEQIVAALEDAGFLPRMPPEMRSSCRHASMISETIARKILQFAVEAALQRLIYVFV